MVKFEFRNPTRIVFGEGQIAALQNLIPMGTRVLLLYGGGSIKRNGVYNQVLAALEGCKLAEFAGIEVNPHYETILKAAEVARQANVGIILAVLAAAR